MTLNTHTETADGAPPRYFAEFFAGIGLVHAGLEVAGFHCAYANDIDPKKFEMYQHRFGDADYYHVEDIWRKEEVLSKIQVPLALATASFPCVDLSLAGRGRGFAGERSGAFFGFLEVLKGLRAKAALPSQVLVENVMGFVSARGGDDFRLAAQCLSELGYWLDVIVVDAKHFTPQSRPRVFMLGFQEHALPRAAKLGCGPGGELRPKKLVAALETLNLATGLMHLEGLDLPEEARTVGRVLSAHQEDWWDDARVSKHINEMSSTHREQLERYATESIMTYGTMYRRVRKGKSRTEIRFDGLAGCLRTPRGGSSKQMVVVAGQNTIKMRWMTPREYAALQGIADFPLRVGKTQALFGFGDAVCVPAITWIAQNYLQG